MEDSRFFLIEEQILLGRRGVYYATVRERRVFNCSSDRVLPRLQQANGKTEIRGEKSRPCFNSFSPILVIEARNESYK